MGEEGEEEGGKIIFFFEIWIWISSESSYGYGKTVVLGRHQPINWLKKMFSNC